MAAATKKVNKSKENISNKPEDKTSSSPNKKRQPITPPKSTVPPNADVGKVNSSNSNVGPARQSSVRGKDKTKNSTKPSNSENKPSSGSTVEPQKKAGSASTKTSSGAARYVNHFSLVVLLHYLSFNNFNNNFEF